MSLPRGARERRIRTGGVELCVAELGDPDRPAVVLVHGYPDSKEVWSGVAARLADRFHVVLYDVRGHGRSTAPVPLRGGFALERLTDDFLAVADAVSPGRPVHLVGHDWGSVQGWEFATAGRTEGRIASFTSVSGPSLDHLGHWIRERVGRPTPRRAGQVLEQGARSWYVYLLHVPVLPELAWRGPLGRRFPGAPRRAGKVPGEGYPTGSLPSDAAHGTWLYRDNVRSRTRRPRPDPYAHAPVQLVTPTGDPFLSQRLHDDLARWAPRLVRRTLRAGHWVPLTHPDRLSAWITEFVTAQEGEDPGLPPAVASGRPYADRFGGQVVLVTGAASGVGRATALAFAEAGARVVAVDRDARGAARTAERARLLGAPGAWAEAVDVGDERAVEELAARVTAGHGTVDVLVNDIDPLPSGSSPEDREALGVGLRGVVHGCRAFGRRMAARGQGGHIVNTVPAAGPRPTGPDVYGAWEEAAVLALSGSLRAELAGRGVGVTAVRVGSATADAPPAACPAGMPGVGRPHGRTVRTRAPGGRSPEAVAAAVLRAVAENRAVVPVTPEARAARLLSRVAPGVLRALAGGRPR